MNRSRPKARLSRALGIPLTPKCVRYFEARPYPPGVHGRARRNPSDYGLRLREKQRLRAQYNIQEAQLERAFQEARRRPGKTGENLVVRLERRLDAVVPLIVVDQSREKMAIRFVPAGELGRQQELALQSVCHVHGRCLLQGMTESVEVDTSLETSAGHSTARERVVNLVLRTECQ